MNGGSSLDRGGISGRLLCYILTSLLDHPALDRTSSSYIAAGDLSSPIAVTQGKGEITHSSHFLTFTGYMQPDCTTAG